MRFWKVGWLRRIRDEGAILVQFYFLGGCVCGYFIFVMLGCFIIDYQCVILLSYFIIELKETRDI